MFNKHSAQQHLHFLGICGTFMGSLAILAKQMGYKVTGCDLKVYPPMSDILEQSGIEIAQGYGVDQLRFNPDCYIVGNVQKRGMPIIEALLNQKLPYLSGPEWLSKTILSSKKVIAISGTHGKTSTASMIAWILEQSGLNPSFLIGGVPENFGVSARLTDSEYFVIEADEYDTAFFDKRSKFIHYQPNILLINNLEFDHADIFDDLKSIQKQFSHVVRLVPESGKILFNSDFKAIFPAIDQPIFSEIEGFSLQKNNQSIHNKNFWPAYTYPDQWTAELNKADGSIFEINNKIQIKWNCLGEHNVQNALGAIACAASLGVGLDQSAKALETFKPVKRRLECFHTFNQIKFYDDFAHHPTAVELSIDALKKHQNQSHSHSHSHSQSQSSSGRVVSILEPRSNTMKMGVHGKRFCESLQKSDLIYLYIPEGAEVHWDVENIMESSTIPYFIFNDLDCLLEQLQSSLQKNDHVLIMSNGAFDGIYQKIKLKFN